MRKESIEANLRELAFDFFYWFSRFEFALKENKFLKYESIGSNAEPGWDAFVEKHGEKFKHTKESTELVKLNPKRQKVARHSNLEWKQVRLDNCRTELCKVVRLLKTIRNNLFHGGKHGADGWDDPNRTQKLLQTSKIILDQLAQVANFEADYTQRY